MADPSTGTISDSFSTMMSPDLTDSVGTFAVLGNLKRAETLECQLAF